MTDERLSIGRTLLAALVLTLAMSVLVLATRPITVVVIPPEKIGGDDYPFDESDDQFAGYDRRPRVVERAPAVIPEPIPEASNGKETDIEKSHIRG